MKKSPRQAKGSLTAGKGRPGCRYARGPRRRRCAPGGTPARLNAVQLRAEGPRGRSWTCVRPRGMAKPDELGVRLQAVEVRLAACCLCPRPACAKSLTAVAAAAERVGDGDALRPGRAAVAQRVGDRSRRACRWLHSRRGRLAARRICGESVRATPPLCRPHAAP